jgi:hypothetical protein
MFVCANKSKEVKKNESHFEMLSVAVRVCAVCIIGMAWVGFGWWGASAEQKSTNTTQNCDLGMKEM